MKRLPPIVLIHGMWCTPQVWSSFARRLEALGFEVWAPALPKPTDPGALGRISIRDYTDSVAAWLQRQNFSTPPIVMGHSLGGIVAQKLAQTHRFSALVLLAPAPPRGINTIHLAGLRTTFRILTSRSFWNRPTRIGWDAARWGLLNRVPEKRAREIFENMVPGSGTVYREIAFWFLSRDRATAVDTARIEIPVFVAAGECDHIIPASVVRKVARRYHGSDYVEYPGAGHWLIEEAVTDDLVACVHSWLMESVPALRHGTMAIQA